MSPDANPMPPPTHDLGRMSSRQPGPSYTSSMLQDDQPIDHVKHQQLYLLKVCRGLMMYGAPTHRLEEYMQRTADVLGLRLQSFYIPGCVMISFNDSGWRSTDVHIVRCKQALNLAKLYDVHAVYKDIIHGRIVIEQAITRLDGILKANDQFPRWSRVIVYGLASMCIGPVSYSARPIDLPMILLLGTLLGVSELVLAARSELYAHIFEIFTTILVSFFARGLGSVKLPNDYSFCFSALCQASLVMILPGFIITNSALELQTKNIVAGSVRMVYGIIFTLFLAFGITIGTTIYGALDSSATSALTCSSPWPFWWQISFVPAFTVAWAIVNQAPWRKMPAMVLVTLAGWVVNHFSGQYFSLNTAISQALGAFTIGILANLSSRLRHGLAAALLHPAIFIQVPGSVAANGGLISGVQSANKVNSHTSSSNGTTLGTGAAQGSFELLNAGFSMIEIAIGITNLKAKEVVKTCRDTYLGDLSIGVLPSTHAYFYKTQKYRVMRHSFSSQCLRIWRLAGLDVETLLKMMKGALPPTIVVAIYQSVAISNITGTLGYLTSIMAIVSQCLLPPGKFLKIMFFIVLSTCASASICCLAVLSAVKARAYTTSASDVEGSYNSNACAVSAAWLLFAMWVSNTLRAYHPVLLQDPMVAFSIFPGVALTHAVQFSTVEQGLGFIKQLLIAFLLGFSIATGISLLIVPISSRCNVLKDIIAYAQVIDNVFEAQKAYIQIAEGPTGLKGATISDNGVDVQFSERHDHQHPLRKTTDGADTNEKQSELNRSMAALIAIHDKLANDLILAESEMAWGKLDNTDLRSIFVLLKAVMLPSAGICMLPDILKELSDNWVQEDESLPQEVWKSFLANFGKELAKSAEFVALGIQHAFVVLGIASSEREGQVAVTSHAHQQPDIEKPAEELVPGDPSFALQFERSVRDFYDQCRNRLVTASPARGDAEAHIQSDTLDSLPNERYTEESLIFLFLQHLTHALLQASVDIVRFAESGVTTQRMRYNRMILPTARGVLWSLTKHDDDKSSSQTAKDHRNPEHLPATNLWERSGTVLGFVPHVLASEQSSFGFRAAAASFSVAILAYLRQTQTFFFEQRLIWVLIVIVIGMSPTSGASLFSFAVRILGTIISLALSLTIWYIVIGHTVGVIVLLYLGNIFGYYFYVKYPKLFGPSVISIVTLNVIVAYELQVNKLGIPRAESSGQPYYPIYLFGTYKLACVIVGCAIALVWTIFPYPLSSGSQARKVLGRSLFVLANFYSCIHTTIHLWITRSPQEDPPVSRALNVAQDKLFADEMRLLALLRVHTHFTKFNPRLGGKFPASIYRSIIADIRTILISMALMVQSTRGMNGPSAQRELEWLPKLSQAIESTSFNSQTTTSLLCHFSAAVANELALPPYLSPPASFGIAREVRKLNLGLLDVSNADNPFFSAFASLEVLNALMSASLTRLASNVKLLVGEICFDGYTERQDSPTEN
ncbi:uncharacterized protein HMPREF1120_04338 [Exophiala dermatitidis NIH/UT8656]|uniref:ER transporter 6TM N-terminal domain-containing protein n=1 Tax=Exophiala dermatitidis (strain ATCC 34100 / CBS 525.76 / NIH/UT8656) TaxID=858893 RepID=H6BXK2_EXODN|nr:uncharacterized protein HMPREF1120_04338 [Exophiala dermatitidis NIH/UT8656]EHY56249.1 hypothetical protein HMPREF1120_04338 [Exophiala dermatitidis NIH/UT8656]